MTGISHNTFLSCGKYHTGLITAKESNHENKLHACSKNLPYGVWDTQAVGTITQNDFLEKIILKK